MQGKYPSYCVISPAPIEKGSGKVYTVKVSEEVAVKIVQVYIALHMVSSNLISNIT